MCSAMCWREHGLWIVIHQWTNIVIFNWPITYTQSVPIFIWENFTPNPCLSFTSFISLLCCKTYTFHVLDFVNKTILAVSVPFTIMEIPIQIKMVIIYVFSTIFIIFVIDWSQMKIFMSRYQKFFLSVSSLVTISGKV